MFSWCVESVGNDRSFSAFDERGSVDVAAAIEWLAKSAERSNPVLVLSVSSALTALFDAMRGDRRFLRLPADSRIVDTGGTKGQQRVLSAKGTMHAAWRYLHVPGYMCVNEYGMTEMLSQFYDNALVSRYRGDLTPRAKEGPHWVRSLIIDPTSLLPMNGDTPGILRHFDLANWESISALQTLDLGRKLEGGFELLGRAEADETRGCSQLMVGLSGLADGSDPSDERCG